MMTLIEDVSEPVKDEQIKPKTDNKAMIMTITFLCVAMFILAMIAYYKNRDTND